MESSPQTSTNYQLSDSAISIIESYFETYSLPWIEQIITSFSEYDSPNQTGKEHALEQLQKAFNYSRQEYEQYLKDSFCDCDDSYQYTIYSFDTFSRYSTGNLKEDDKLLADICRISNQSKEELQRAIGNYFKTNFNSYLREKYLDLYEKCEALEIAKILVDFNMEIEEQGEAAERLIEMSEEEPHQFADHFKINSEDEMMVDLNEEQETNSAIFDQSSFLDEIVASSSQNALIVAQPFEGLTPSTSILTTNGHKIFSQQDHER